jgi:tRNA(fMet)-specific endonuclease VapC
MYIFDTDHVSLFLRGNPTLIQNFEKRFANPSESFYITIVTVQELLNGWITRINSTKESDQLVNLYTKFWQTHTFLSECNVLNFDETANSIYKALLNDKSLHKKRLIKDLRIAAIVLATDSILVTRNTKDFQQIPNLSLEDWTQG